MARHEGDIRGEVQKPLSLADLVALLGDAEQGDARSREHVIACYLAGGDGWDQAVKLLGGTFAGGAAELKERKAD